MMHESQTTNNDMQAIGEMAALDAIDYDVFVASLNAFGYSDKERKQAIKGYRKFARPTSSA